MEIKVTMARPIIEPKFDTQQERIDYLKLQRQMDEILIKQADVFYKMLGLRREPISIDFGPDVKARTLSWMQLPKS